MSDDHDELDPLDDRQAEIEARFRKLERDAEIERLRSASGRAEPAGSPKPGAASGAQAPDPLAQMKADLERERGPAGDGELFLLVLCPKCNAKNRMSLNKVRTQSPVCGGCHSPLSFARR